MLSIAALILSGAALALAKTCDDVDTPCLDQKTADENNSTERCLVGERYFQCLETVLREANSTGVCGELGLLEHRFKAYLDLEPALPSVIINLDGCHSTINTSDYFTLSNCEKLMVSCGYSLLAAFTGWAALTNIDKCSYLLNFEDCLEKTIPSCSRTVVEGVVQRAYVSYGHSLNCSDLPVSTTATPTGPENTPGNVTPVPPNNTVLVASVTGVVAVVLIVVVVIVVVVVKKRRAANARSSSAGQGIRPLSGASSNHTGSVTSGESSQYAVIRSGTPSMTSSSVYRYDDLDVLISDQTMTPSGYNLPAGWRPDGPSTHHHHHLPQATTDRSAASLFSFAHTGLVSGGGGAVSNGGYATALDFPERGPSEGYDNASARRPERDSTLEPPPQWHDVNFATANSRYLTPIANPDHDYTTSSVMQGLT